MIRTAQDMGLHVLALDMNPDSPGKHVADDFAAISTKDVPAITAYLDECKANGWNIVGINTMGSDIPDIVAEVSAHLGTPSISAEAAANGTDKKRMKDCFRKHHVPIPWYKEIASFPELEDIILERGQDVVIKPTDRSGSRGVFCLKGVDDVKALFDISLDFSFGNKVLVEEFLDGPQISTETILINGKAHTVGFADRNYDDTDQYLPQIIENGGWIPTRLSQSERSSIEDLVEQASIALGVENGVTKGDVVLTNSGPVMIEMAVRLSGGDFSAGLVPLSSGVNYVQTVIELSTGRKPDMHALTPTHDVAVANRYFFPKPGRLPEIQGIDEVRSWPWVEKLEFWFEPGQDLPDIQSHAQRFGVFVVTAPDRDILEERITKVYDTIKIISD